MKHDISKLPKWAQEKIETLALRLREARRTIEEQANPGPTRVAVNLDWVEGGRADYWAPNDARIRFFLPDGRWIVAELENDRLLLRGSKDFLIVRPYVANVVIVDVGP